MVTREHLYMLMARCYEKSQQLAGLTFTEAEKNQLRDELVAYAHAIYTLSIKRVNTENRDYHARMSILLTQMMTFLVDSHNNPINRELEYVVRKLVTDWNINLNTNIILFSHGDYAVLHYNASVFKILNQLYRLTFSRQPRIVYFPREYDGDVLFSSVVFHEVGHMVENDRSLGGKVYDELIKTIQNPRATILKNYFIPDYDQKAVNEDRMRAYIKEYISDLFGAQYLGRNILHYLNCHDSLIRKKDTSEHPCYDCRERLVESFMNYTSVNPNRTTDKFLQIIIDVFHNEGAIPDLRLRDLNLSKDNLVRGNNHVLANQQELFSLFSAAWRASLSGLSAVEAARGMANGALSRYDYYNTINEATKQSVADYMVINP